MSEQDFVDRKALMEQHVLAALMICNGLADIKPHVSRLKESDFSTSEFIEIFRSIDDLVKREVLPDLVTLHQNLIDRGLSDRIRGSRLVEIAEGTYSSQVLHYYLPILLELNARIRFKLKVSDLDVFSIPYEDLCFEVDSLKKDLLTVSSVSDQLITPDLMIDRRKADMQEYLNTTSVLTGFDSIDKELTYGFAATMLSTISARPMHGKSTLKANLTVRMCKLGYGIYNVNTEQRNFVEQNRLDSIMLQIPLTDIIRMRQWDKSDPRFQRLAENIEYIAQHWNYYSTDNSQMTIDLLERNVDSIKSADRRLDVIFIDLFDRLSDVDMDSPSVILKKLTQLDSIAKRYLVHVCVIAQIHRLDPKTNKDQWPRIRDIKWAGAFEEVSRLILLLHRPGLYNPDPSSDNKMDVIIAKQNDGKAGERFIRPLIFDGAYLTLREPSEEEKSDDIKETGAGLTKVNLSSESKSDNSESVDLGDLLNE